MKKSSVLILIIFTLSSTLGLFQNCSEGLMSSTMSSYKSIDPEALAALKSCQLQDRNIPDQTSVEAFQNAGVKFGEECVSETRQCKESILLGSYNHLRCVVDAPKDCSFNQAVVAHDRDVVGFQNSTVPFGTTCQSQSRRCINGELSGTYAFGSCAVDAPMNCRFNDKDVLHAQSIKGFLASSVPFGQQCTFKDMTCFNGNLPEANMFKFTTCNVDAPKTCIFNGRNYAHGEKFQGFTTSTVPFGSTCNGKTLECVNGNVAEANTFSFPSCAVNAPKTCVLDGQSLAHGQVVVGFKNEYEATAATCESNKFNLTCNNGTVANADQFKKRSCAGIPTSCRLDIQECPANPGFAGGYLDNYNGSANNPDACALRAQDFKSYCQSNYPATTSFLRNGIAIQSTTVGNRCEITLRDCPNGRTTAQTLNDSDLGAIAGQNRCMQRAEEYRAYCDSYQPVTAQYFVNGAVVQSTSTAARVPKCEIQIQGNCPVSPGSANQTFEDGDASARTSQVRCMQRAQEYSNWCGNLPDVTSRFLINSVVQQTQSVPRTKKSCTLDGRTVAHGQTMTTYFYKTSFVNDSSSCSNSPKHESICNNGTFDFAYQYSSCTQLQSACVITNPGPGKCTALFPLGYGAKIESDPQSSQDIRACLSKANLYDQLCENKGSIRAAFYSGGEVVMGAQPGRSCFFQGREYFNGEFFKTYKGSYANCDDFHIMSCEDSRWRSSDFRYQSLTCGV